MVYGTLSFQSECGLVAQCLSELKTKIEGRQTHMHIMIEFTQYYIMHLLHHFVAQLKSRWTNVYGLTDTYLDIRDICHQRYDFCIMVVDDVSDFFPKYITNTK